jgi:hypothetical protein
MLSNFYFSCKFHNDFFRFLVPFLLKFSKFYVMK